MPSSTFGRFALLILAPATILSTGPTGASSFVTPRGPAGNPILTGGRWTRFAPPRPKHGTDVSLHVSDGDGGEDNGPPSVPDDFDVDGARAALENIIGTTGDDDASSPSAPPIAAPAVPSPARRLREREIALLRDLAPPPASRTGDPFDDGPAVAALWEFWFRERGESAAAELRACEADAYRMAASDFLRAKSGARPLPENDPANRWAEVEDRMRDLARSHGIKGPAGVSAGAAGGRVDAYSWVEPLNRLATLLFQRGRYEESARACRAILTERPWHFGALSGIVMCYRNLGENDKADRVWAPRCMPRLDPVDNYRRRRDWVKRNVEDAERTLGNK